MVTKTMAEQAPEERACFYLCPWELKRTKFGKFEWESIEQWATFWQPLAEKYGDDYHPILTREQAVESLIKQANALAAEIRTAYADGQEHSDAEIKRLRRLLHAVARAAEKNKPRLPECDCMGPGGMCPSCELGYATVRALAALEPK